MRKYKSFVSFEGIDFCGKSTQIELLVEKLKHLKLAVRVLREPGGTAISEKIRQILLDTENINMHPHTELLLYSAARAQLVNQSILPDLKKGIYVLADRFFDSTTTYQGYGRSIDLNFIEQLNRFATSDVEPYATFFIDIPPAEAEKRRQKNNFKRDRMENEGKIFYSKIRKGYVKLWKSNPQRFIKLDGLASVDEISEKIWSTLCGIWDLPLSKKG
jgi:dTMP kinase